MATFKQILRDAVRRLLSRPAEGDTVSVAKREAARFVERRQMRFGERRGFAERQARAAELQVLLAVELADREAGRHAARIWAIILGMLVLVLCCVLVVLIYPQISGPIHQPPIDSGGAHPTDDGPGAGGNGTLTWLGWSTLAAGLFVFLCIGVILATGSPVARAVATALAVTAPLAVTGLSTLSLFKGGSFIKIEKFDVKFSDFAKSDPRKPDSAKPNPDPPENEPPDGSKRPVELSLEINVKQDKESPAPVGVTGKAELLCELNKRLLRVGTFASGEPETLEERDIQTVENLTGKIDELATGKRLLGVLLIGSADKTHMTSETERRYDSNFVLAQLRARWVKEQLIAAKEKGKLADIPAIFVLNAGPTYVGPKVDVAQLAEDRSVRACLMVQPLQ